jgi:hypothetical protein
VNLLSQFVASLFMEQAELVYKLVLAWVAEVKAFVAKSVCICC